MTYAERNRLIIGYHTLIEKQDRPPQMAMPHCDGEAIDMNRNMANSPENGKRLSPVTLDRANLHVTGVTVMSP